MVSYSIRRRVGLKGVPPSYDVATRPLRVMTRVRVSQWSLEGTVFALLSKSPRKTGRYEACDLVVEATIRNPERNAAP